MNPFSVPVARFILVSLLALSLGPARASATQLLSDPFDYPAGPLVGHGGWIAHNSSGWKPVQVTAGSVRIDQSSGTGEDVSVGFTPRPPAARTYAGFTLRVPAAGVGATWEYFTHFREAAPDTLIYRSRAYVGAFTGSGYQIGVTSTSSGVNHPVVVWPTPLSYGVTYRIVQSYDGATGTSELWVDPSSEASPKIWSNSPSAAASDVGSFAFRQGSLNTSLQDIGILRVATTFNEALPPKEVPAANPWTMLALAAALAGAGGALVARRRREALG